MEINGVSAMEPNFTMLPTYRVGLQDINPWKVMPHQKMQILGMISHKNSLVTIFGNNRKIKNFI